MDITVTTPSGTSSTGTADKFTFATAPTVTNVSPTSGSTGGGTSVTITGTNFFPTCWVYFGTVLATSVTYTSSTSLTAVSPAESAGTVDIRVDTEIDVSATSSADQFTFGGSPQILTGGGNTSFGASGGALTARQLQAVIPQAVADLQAAGFSVAALGQARFQITTLPAPLLALTNGKNIWIDATADGHGWYTGDAHSSAFAVHAARNEFLAAADSPAYGHVDLLTVVTHELGHILGFASINPAVQADDWMTATLATGERRSPDVARISNPPSVAGLTHMAASGRIGNPPYEVGLTTGLSASPDQSRLTVQGSLVLPFADGFPLGVPVYPGRPVALDKYDLFRPKPMGTPGQALIAGDGDSILLGGEGRPFLVGGVSTEH